MNYKYKICKKLQHEPVLMVLYTPDVPGLSERLIQVRYEPSELMGIPVDQVDQIVHKLCVKQAPVQEWLTEQNVSGVSELVEAIAEDEKSVDAMEHAAVIDEDEEPTQGAVEI